MLLALTLARTLTLSPAFAQDNPLPLSSEYRPETIIDFGRELSVVGELVRPTGGIGFDTRRGVFNPLIRLRVDFRDELAKSVDEAR